MTDDKLTSAVASALGKRGGQTIVERIARGELPADYFSRLGKKGGAAGKGKAKPRKDQPS